MLEPFEAARQRLENQYDNLVFPPETGLSTDELKAIIDSHLRDFPEEPRILTRAFILATVIRHARFAVETGNPFCGKIAIYTPRGAYGQAKTTGYPKNDALKESNLFTPIREQWRREELAKRITPEDQAEVNRLGGVFMIDTSHVSPDWAAILKLGFTGLRDRSKAAGNKPLHQAVTMVYDAAIDFCRRCGKACHNEAMLALAERPPQTLEEAFVMAYTYHELAEIDGEEIRTMGWFDRLYIDFYRRDLAAGRLTRNTAKTLIKYFWVACYAKYRGLRFGKNFCFGPDINELSYLGMETYYEMNIVDPKLSVRVTPDTPQAFLESCARNIRDGRTGIVMLNDAVIIAGLIKHGRTPEDAQDYIPIGCYEPAVLGKEVSISGATSMRLAQVFDCFLHDNRPYPTFDDFYQGFKALVKHTIDLIVKNQRKCEEAWPLVSPAPFLSGSFQNCLDTGKDYSEGGCVYNSTGHVFQSTAEAADCLAAVNYLVYDKQLCTLDELRQACTDNWQGHERLQAIAKAKAPKYGNNDNRADAFAVDLADTFGPYINSLPNGRGGHMFASIYGQLVIDHGRTVGALPNGRNAGEPLSKNMCACIGMDKNGITALMETVLKIDMRNFPCGTCLDLMLHPSSVSGDDGIHTLVHIIRTFISRGGSGLQFNIFDADTLRDAQANPQKYPNLQVRVCGWNARFVDLKTAEQDTFIRQASS